MSPQQNTPVGTTYPIPPLTSTPQGTQIAAAGGSIVNSSVLATVFIAPVPPGGASDSQISALNPGGAINWPTGVACWAWCSTDPDATVFVSPGLSTYQPGGPPWLGQGALATETSVNDYLSKSADFTADGNGWVISDAMLSLLTPNSPPQNSIQLLAGFVTSTFVRRGFFLCQVDPLNMVDHFDSTRGFFLPAGESLQLIAQNPSDDNVALTLSILFDHL